MPKDQVFFLKDGRVFGAWDTEALAEAGMETEQRRAAKRKKAAR